MERYLKLRSRLIEQGAEAGTLDAFAAVVRELEDATIAESLTSAADDVSYTLHQIGRDALNAVAHEVASFR